MNVILTIPDNSWSCKLEQDENGFSVEQVIPESQYTMGQSADDIQVISVVDGETYDGEYEATPRFVAQTLETKNKYLYDDVSVRAITVSRVSNPSGGNTVWIGEE